MLSFQIAETCQLAIERLKWLSNPEQGLSKNPYLSVDPAPPLPGSDVKTLEGVLVDEKRSLFERYRAMFALRNIGGADAAASLTSGCSHNSIDSFLCFH